MDKRFELADLRTMDGEIRERSFGYAKRRSRRRGNNGSGGGAFAGDFLTVLPGAFQIMVSDQGVTDGATITRADRSGNGKDYVAVGHNPTVASTLNGRATLLFNGSSQYISSTLNLVAPSTTPWEMVMVCKLNAYNVGGRLASDAAGSSVLFQTGSPGIAAYTTVQGTVSAGLVTGVWSLVKQQSTNSTADLVQAGNTAAAALPRVNTASPASSGRSIAADGLGANFSNIEVALVAYGPVGFAGATFLAALDTYYNSLVLHP